VPSSHASIASPNAHSTSSTTHPLPHTPQKWPHIHESHTRFLTLFTCIWYCNLSQEEDATTAVTTNTSTKKVTTRDLQSNFL
jgi:hypothetical protein